MQIGLEKEMKTSPASEAASFFFCFQFMLNCRDVNEKFLRTFFWGDTLPPEFALEFDRLAHVFERNQVPPFFPQDTWRSEEVWVGKDGEK